MAVVNHGELVIQGSVPNYLIRSRLSTPSKFHLLIQRSNSSDTPWVEVLSLENDGIEVRVEPGHSSELNRLLVTNNIEVSSFYPHRTLEEFFLKITKGTSEI